MVDGLGVRLVQVKGGKPLKNCKGDSEKGKAQGSPAAASAHMEEDPRFTSASARMLQPGSYNRSPY